uniref:Pleckstrin and Sec7 domain containing n=1 Tax=Peromyscus maniculatus bairdii TaxID=230844 RepID=A0A8C8TDS4_PERMB
MAQGAMRFCSEGDCAISPPRCPRRWLPEGPVPQSPPASMYGSTGSLIRRVVGPGPRGRDLGRVTAPCTPLRGPPSPRMAPSRWGPSSPTGQPPPGAQSSVVIFRFVEKASVRPLNGLPASGGLSRSWDLGGVSPPRPAPALGPGCNRKLRLEASTSDPLPAGGGSALPGSRDPSRGPLVPPQIGADGLYSSLPNGLGGTPEHLAMHFRGPADTGFLNQGDTWSSTREVSSHAQRIARAKWEFFYGSLDAPSSGAKPPEQALPSREVGSKQGSGVAVGRAAKYSETDLDTVPLRCYRETDIDEVLAEREEADSAIESQPSSEGPAATARPPASRPSPCPGPPSSLGSGNEDDEAGGEEDVDDEVFEASEGPRPGDHMLLSGPLKSPVPFLPGTSPSADGPDSFSCVFEAILESHRAKGTSYSSLASLEALASPGPTKSPFFTFEMPPQPPAPRPDPPAPAPLAPLEPDSGTSSAADGPWTQRQEAEESDAGAKVLPRRGLPSPSHSEDSLGLGAAPLGSSEPPLSQLVSDSDSELDSTERLALGSTDTLSNGQKADLEAAQRLAKRLYRLDGFRKADVARHLGKNNDFSKLVAGEYLKFFVFTGMTLDQALRVFLKELALMGETQERERVLAHFSQRYFQCNPEALSSEDGAHTLTCALMLLNTDLHGHNIGKRMTCGDFIGNLEGLNDGGDFPRELLKALYSSIKNEKLQWAIDEEELRRSLSELADPNPKVIKRVSGGSGSSPFLDLTPEPGAAVYKHGALVRKVHADPDCRKTPRGKRGWKSFHGILKGMILYLQKEEYQPGKALSEAELKNAISIHHALATRASDYSKRPHVFYLRTADWRVFLFQAPSLEQMQSWITRINVVAAMFSAPPFPAAVSSQKKFSRPLLPSAATRLSQEEQVRTHEAKMKAMASELREHRAAHLGKKARGKEAEEQRQKEAYLEFEKSRYGTYAALLRVKMKAASEELDAIEAALAQAGSTEDGCPPPHSSPSLQPNPTSQTRAQRPGSEARAGAGNTRPKP